MTGVARPECIRGISLDLGNTIYPLGSAQTSNIIRRLHEFLEVRLKAAISLDSLNRLYCEIRTRQFSENRATLCENDFNRRLHEMIAETHGPPDADLIQEASDAYSRGFVAALTLPEGTRDTVSHLADRFDGNVAVCSNFILVDPILEVLDRDGLLPYLKCVIVSCAVGFIKPHPLIFETVARALGLYPCEIAHVGDDLDADIHGAKRAGMTTVYSREFVGDASPADIAAAPIDFAVDRLQGLISLFDEQRQRDFARLS